MNYRKLFLVRHAQSYKNIRDEHGGIGDSLASEGIRQCRKFCSFLRSEELRIDNTILFWHSIPQVAETASIICAENGYRSVCDERLKGIHLGVLAGLSRGDALRLFPEPARRLELWREGRMTIDGLDIPEAETAFDFHQRARSFIDQRIWPNKTRNILTIATRSTMIMILNIFLLGENFNFKAYRVYDLDCASVTKLIFSRIKVSLKYLNYTDFLKENVKSSGQTV